MSCEKLPAFILRTCLRVQMRCLPPTRWAFRMAINTTLVLPVGLSFGTKSLTHWSPLAPDFLKALVATESGFDTPRDVQSKVGPARGLIQITEQTRRILQDPKGELKDYLIEMTVEESRDPEVNIAAGTRWLYHKKQLANRRLKREATWEEAVAEYKGILPVLGKNPKSDRIMQALRDYLKHLKEKRALK